MSDVSHINTYPELVVFLNQVESEIMMGLDPDDAERLSRKAQDIKRKMLDAQKRQETLFEGLARECKSLQDEIARAPRRRNAA